MVGSYYPAYETATLQHGNGKPRTVCRTAGVPRTGPTGAASAPGGGWEVEDREDAHAVGPAAAEP
mgnify:CR=1 FL=1